MKVQSVLIDGFTNLSNVKIKFDKITALIALNNFGKTNAIGAINFGLEFIKSTPAKKTLMMSTSSIIPISKITAGKNYKFEIEILTELDGTEYRVVYGYEFPWRYNEKIDPCIATEYFKMRPENSGQKYTQLIIRTKDRAAYKSSETGRCSSEINIEQTGLVINKLLAYDNLFYANIIKEINDIKFYIESNLNVDNLFLQEPFIRRGLEDISINFDNIPSTIYYLKKKHKDKFDLLVDIYKTLFPSIKTIKVARFQLAGENAKKSPGNAPLVTTDSIYFLLVEDKNLRQLLNFGMMSEGAKRVFLILTRIIVANILNISLIAIEEPESSVHPSLLQSYIRIVSQLLGDCKVIMTSHSPYLVSYLNPAWIYVGVSRYSGVAEFFAFKKSGRDLLQHDAAEFDMSMGDYLFSMLADEESNWENYLERDTHA